MYFIHQNLKSLHLKTEINLKLENVINVYSLHYFALLCFGRFISIEIDSRRSGLQRLCLKHTKAINTLMKPIKCELEEYREVLAASIHPESSLFTIIKRIFLV